MSGLRKAADLILPRSGPGKLLALGACVDSVGSGMFFAVSTLYFVGVVGMPAAKVAYAVTIAGGLALFLPVPAGRLADRLGSARVYTALLVLLGIGSGCYSLVTHYPAYLVLTVLITALDRACSPVQQAVISDVMGGGADRTRTLASVRAVRNVGLTVGFLLGGAVFAIHSRPAFVLLFLGNGVSYLVIALSVRRAMALAHRADGRAAAPGRAGPATAAVPSGAAGGAVRQAVRPPFRNPWFMVFMVANGVLSLYDTLLLVLLPVWVIQDTRVPPSAVPLLLAINTVLTVGLQVFVARFAQGVAASVRLLLVSGAVLAGCCGCFALAQASAETGAIVAAAAGVVLLSLAENLQAVAAWDLSLELSPEPARARYLAAFSLGLTGQKVVGPTLLVAWLLPLGIVVWPVLAGMFAGAALVCRTAVERQVAGRPLMAAALRPTDG